MKSTLALMKLFPEQLEEIYNSVPADYVNWKPESWEGIPSETFTMIEQICHVRDIEIDGYHVRLRRMLEESDPTLESIDSYAVARERNYPAADPQEVLDELKSARIRTLEIAQNLTELEWNRTGSFEGYGQLTARG
jgi:hypothetical protein